MFDKLVAKVISAAKKNRRLLIPAVVCLWMLFALEAAASAVRRHYGMSRSLIFLFCCLAVAGGAFFWEYPISSAAARGAASMTGAASTIRSQAELPAPPAPTDEEGPEPVPAPNDPEHSDQTAGLPANQEDKSDPRQNQLMDTVTKYVGMLKINQVTPDWAPDLARNGSEPMNRVYYEKAWGAYEELTLENRDRLASETLQYLLTCHSTVTGE